MLSSFRSSLHCQCNLRDLRSPGFCRFVVGLEAAPAQEIAFVPQGEAVGRMGDESATDAFRLRQTPKTTVLTLGGDLMRRTEGLRHRSAAADYGASTVAEISNLDRLRSIS